MDILAHTLWAGAGAALLHHRAPVARRTLVVLIGLAALPDLVQMLPITAWWLLGDGTLAAVKAFAMALPGQEPTLPTWVAWLSHHLHCLGHSAVIAGAVTALAWWWTHALWLPLLGWWSHIVIDVFTHSADYYASPVLYPLTQRGFDGIAWNQPWFMTLNYLALALAGVGLVLLRAKRSAGR